MVIACNNPSSADEFQRCILNIKQTALKSGVSQKSVDDALKTARHIPEVLKLDRDQPEFTLSYTRYIKQTVTSKRVETGLDTLNRHIKLLQNLKKKYGIPPHILMAFWGLESNFGQNLGSFNIIDSLSTLACDNRRSEFFTIELISALKLMDTFGFKRDDMLGSWAGAVGHTQFLPSNYQKYALSYDNNAPPNLWRSIPDALISAANFLNEIGWQENQEWGQEVTLPEHFDYRLAGLTTSKTLKEWQKIGIRTATNENLPEHNTLASLLVPGGHQNATFLVYKNFHVIMKWNRSSLYAISVGLLSDQINGHKPLQKPLKDEKVLTRADLKILQNKLNSLGFDSGKADGIIGPTTQQAISAFQYSVKLIPDGYPGYPVFQSIGIKRN